MQAEEQGLAQAARTLLQQGATVEAERLFTQLLNRFPRNVEALNATALAAQRDGDSARALQLLASAAVSDPQDALTRHHTGRIQEARGELQAAIGSYREAVRLKPEFRVARLYLATLLQQTGEHRLALLQYLRAIRDAQSQGVWVNESTTPANLRPLVAQAVEILRRDRPALFAHILEPLATQYGRESLARVARCVRIYTGEEAPVSADPRQQPSFLFFPGLPTSPYLAGSLFAWIPAVENATNAIRQELAGVSQSDHGRERVFGSEALEDQNLRGLDAPPSWTGYYFYRHGERREDNCVRCPVTAATLDQLPLCRVSGHGPEVLFSVFTPGTQLLSHCGVTNTRVVGHLPLVIPDDCALSVGGEVHRWQEGKVVVFDDTYAHEAWNRSAQIRVVLIFDLWNPHLTEVERLAVRSIVEDLGEMRESLDHA